MTRSPLVHRSMAPTARNIRDLVRSDASLIDLNPPYQRGDVWTDEQRINLIRSLMLGVPIAALVFNQRGGNAAWARNERDPDPECWYAAIDGKQRLTTLMQWFGGALSVPAWWFEDRFLAAVRDGWVTYNELSLVGQRMTGNRFLIPVAEAHLGSLAEEAEVYLLLNSAGTAHSGADLDVARSISQAVKP